MTKLITPGPDYDAALWGAAVGVRRNRRFLGVSGKAPGDMLKGLVTSSLPAPFGVDEGGCIPGSVAYSALLTAKGKMITDLRIFRDRVEGFLLEVPWEGAEGAIAHFETKYKGKKDVFQLGLDTEWDRMATQVGKTVTVFGTLGKKKLDKSPYIVGISHKRFIDFALVAFDKAEIDALDLDRFDGQYLYVRGLLTTYKGKVQFKVQNIEKMWME